MIAGLQQVDAVCRPLAGVLQSAALKNSHPLDELVVVGIFTTGSLNLFHVTFAGHSPDYVDNV